MQEYEVPEWVKISKENEKEYDKIEEVEIGGKEMRVRKHVNYKDDYDDDFYDDTISERSNLNKKRKIENLSNIDSFEMENRSNKKRKFGSESNSLRQSQVDLSNYGDERSRNNNNVNINLGNNKVKIKLNDDDDDDEQENDEEIHLDEDDEDEK